MCKYSLLNRPEVVVETLMRNRVYKGENCRSIVDAAAQLGDNAGIPPDTQYSKFHQMLQPLPLIFFLERAHMATYDVKIEVLMSA